MSNYKACKLVRKTDMNQITILKSINTQLRQNYEEHTVLQVHIMKEQICGNQVIIFYVCLS